MIIGGPTRAVAVTDSAVYAGQGGALAILQPFDPSLSRQVVLGQAQLPGEIEKIAVIGSSAFIAAGNAGIIEVQVSDPASPAIRQAIPSADHTYYVAVDGAVLGAADDMGGARFFNISRSGVLTGGGVYRTLGAARAVAISGATAYVLDEAQGLMVLDISNPSSPKLSGTNNHVQLGQALAVTGGRAYVADLTGNFIVMDVSDPSAPAILGRTRLADIGRSIAIQNGEAYVAVGFAGIQALDISTPSAPIPVGVYNPAGYIVGAAMSPRTPGVAYLADTTGGVRGVDLINLDKPPVLGVFKSK
ncbi:MAG: hypothetical protein NTX50_28725 [Candidatus Sumerlaeota bacterium]|nr:hypothetical protein [Candidatus Sumerlaeota bacterium]